MDIYQKQAALLRLMAHPMRLQILDVLRSGDECVCHLSVALGKPQPHISQQLAILRNSGVIVDAREGTNVFYHLADATVIRMVEVACNPTPAPARGEIGKQRHAIHGCNCPKCAGVTSDRG